MAYLQRGNGRLRWNYNLPSSPRDYNVSTPVEFFLWPTANAASAGKFVSSPAVTWKKSQHMKPSSTRRFAYTHLHLL